MQPHRTVASVHNDWLTLVEPVGAFLTIPVLKRVFPNGIAPVDRDVRADVRQRLDEMTTDVAARTAWLQWIVRDLLSLGPRLREASAIPAGLTHTVAERHTTLRPDFVIVEPQKDGPDRARLLGIRWPLRTPIDRRPITDERGQPTTWAATPIERAALLCRAVNVPLALVTDTDRFALVWAPASGPSGHAIWTSSLFGEERLLLDSFTAVLGAQRFFGVAERETLEALLTEGGSAQAEVTGKLGEQVRKAVELLVDAFSRADRAAGGRILAAVQPSHVYNAAVTVMMRLVVLLAAEERRLLPADDPIYSASYSILTTRDQLERDAMRDGIETLEKRHAAWHRLLATFRAVHAGIEHDRLRLPAYGGSLFDPSRYPFLDAPPIPVDDRAMLAVLDALQVLSFRQGGVTEARRISYLNLEVEQIGHVYEGLLDHGCARVNEVVLGLIGSKGEEPEIALGDLERKLRDGEDSFAAWVAEKGGPQASRVKKLLFEDLDPDQDHRLLAACDNDRATYDRVRPFGGLVRKDLRELPEVFMPGALYVTQVSLRRDSGTAYTTKELANEVVQYALEPLVYSPGPAEGAEPADWKLKSSPDLLRLKVCDPAVGSGAILVAACRYLADRLVEAWRAEANTGQLPAILEGVHESEWTLVARRSVTDHCLYGVDRNPMALEMAKLSLWLTTMARERPFTFLDHQLRSGDSLLGIASLDQVRWFHVDPSRGKELWKKKPLFSDPRKAVDSRVDQALEKARALAAIDVISLGDVDRKSRLHAEMVEALAPLEVVAGAVIGAALAEAGGEGKLDALLESIANRVEEAFSDSKTADARARAVAEVGDKARFWLDTGKPDLALDRSCLHWPLAFPEVFLAPGRSGFDAIVGNPPFVKGHFISRYLGDAYRNVLTSTILGGASGGLADLVAYFFRRASALLSKGVFSFLATNSLSDGDTARVGLQTLLEEFSIIRAHTDIPWPGSSAVVVHVVALSNLAFNGDSLLNGVPVTLISARLEEDRGWMPMQLSQNAGLVATGSYPLPADGFEVSERTAREWLANDESYSKVVLPYINGKELYSLMPYTPTRWIISFWDWPEGEAARYVEAFEHVRTRVKPVRDDVNRKRRRELWWIYAENAPGLYEAIGRGAFIRGRNRAARRSKRLDFVIAKAKTSNTWEFVRLDANAIFDQSLVIVASESYALLAQLQSVFHLGWAMEQGSSLKTDLSYTPSTVFETYPFAPMQPELEKIGEVYDRRRLEVASARKLGLTALGHKMSSQAIQDQDIVELRQLRVAIDHSVAQAYGWTEMNLEHGFYEASRGVEFSVSPDTRQTIIRRLLELNRQRYGEEVAQGLHEKGRSEGKADATGKKSKKAPKPSPLLEGV